MPLTKLVLRPGINRETTNFANEGGYWACDKIRFRSGFPEKIGGWTLYSASEFWGVSRNIMPYQCSCGATLNVVGTNLKIYAEFGAAYYDITPITTTVVAASNAFTTDTATPTVIYVNNSATPFQTGDFVTIYGVASAINGVPASEINGEHRITLVSGSQFKFTVATPPTSSGTTGACTIEYQLTTGAAIYTVGTGWGTSTWGRGTWGSSSSVGVGQQLRLWSMDNYGDDVVFGPRGGGLYLWKFYAGTGLTPTATSAGSFVVGRQYTILTIGDTDFTLVGAASNSIGITFTATGVGAGTGTANTQPRGTLVSSLPWANHVPSSQNFMLVSDQSRFVITLGSNDYGGTDAVPMLVRWSDQENYLEWEPTATTQAGSQLMSVGSTLVCAAQTRQEILVWSDSALFSMQYLGPPYVFGFTTLADNISIVGPNAAIVVNNVAYWMGTDKFYAYDGKAQTLPSSLRTYVYSRLNQTQAWQVTVGHIEKFSEIWWFYPSTGASYNDSYVVFNYLDNLWYYGSLARFALNDTGLYTYPISSVYDSATEKGKLYYQEYGVDDATTLPVTAIEAHVETSDFDIGEGDNFGLVNRIIPDISFAGSTSSTPTAYMAVTPRRAPGAAYETTATTTVAASQVVPVEVYTEQVFVRVRGRQMKFKVSSTGAGVAWQLGMPRIQMRPDGRK